MKAAELRSRIVEAPEELTALAEQIASRNGAGPDEDLRQQALDFAGEVVADADRLDLIERKVDGDRDGIRRQALDLIASLDGDGERARDETWTKFREDNGDLPIEHLRRRLRCPDLRRVIKHGRSNSLWDLELQDGSRIPLGNSEQIQEPKKVRGALLSVGRPIERFSLKDFDSIVEAFALVAEVEDTIASETEETLAWIASFVNVMSGDRVFKLEPDQLLRLVENPDEQPAFCDGDGRLYLRLARLSQHVTRHIGQRTTVRDLAARLDRCGFAKKQLAAREGEGTIKARYWRSLPGFDSEASA